MSNQDINKIAVGEFIDYNFVRGGQGSTLNKIRVYNKKDNHTVVLSREMSTLLGEKGFFFLTYRYYRIPQTSVLIFGKEGNLKRQPWKEGWGLRWKSKSMVEVLLDNTSLNCECAEFDYIRKDMDDGRIALVLEGGKAL